MQLNLRFLDGLLGVEDLVVVVEAVLVFFRGYRFALYFIFFFNNIIKFGLFSSTDSFDIQQGNIKSTIELLGVRSHERVRLCLYFAFKSSELGEEWRVLDLVDNR